MRIESEKKSNGNTFMMIGIVIVLLAAVAGGVLIKSWGDASSDKWDADAENRDNPVNTEAIQRSLEK